MSATKQKLPGPDHPITLKATPSRVVVSIDDRVVADTSNGLEMREGSYAPVIYVPMTDVDASVLQPSETTTYCPYKGTASYYSLKTPDGLVQDAVWFYRTPYEPVAEIAGHVAFYPDRVQIEAG